jgi:hypothetical protein
MNDDSDTVPFDIRIEGENTGDIWTGTFRAKKRLSHRSQLKKDQIRRDLLGQQAGQSTERAQSTAMILAELSVRLTKAPPWWSESDNGLDLADDNVIGVVFDKAMAIEAEAIAEIKKKAEAAKAEMRAEAVKAAEEEK